MAEPRQVWCAAKFAGYKRQKSARSRRSRTQIPRHLYICSTLQTEVGRIIGQCRHSQLDVDMAARHWNLTGSLG